METPVPHPAVTTLLAEASGEPATLATDVLGEIARGYPRILTGASGQLSFAHGPERPVQLG